MEESKWTIKAKASGRSDVLNLIRNTIEKEFKIPENLPVKLVNLTLGDPSKENGYPVSEVTNEAIIETVKAEKFNGYTASNGSPAARQALVEKYSTEEAPFTADDVLLTFGCSGAQYAIFSTMCEPGDNVLVPKPGFPLCFTFATNLGIELKYYDLDPENKFEIILDSLESQIDERTKFILVVNPSNPCGSVFSKSHMEDIIAISEKHQVPLVADEIYYGYAYDEERPFISFAHVNTTIPIITLGALSKIYSVPGWRLGWLIVYNRSNYFDDILDKLKKFVMMNLHPCSLVQNALIRILKEVPDSYFEATKAKLKQSADYSFEVLSGIKGFIFVAVNFELNTVKPIKAIGAMYMMVLIDIEEFEDITDDVDFCKKLLNEQYCFVLPGKCFFTKNMFRVVLCHPEDTFNELSKRLKVFCDSHYKK